MTSPIRLRLFAVAALVASLVAGATHLARSAKAKEKPAASEHLVLGDSTQSQPETMEEFLTAVTKDVDTYWTKVFKDSGLPEPKVSYDWIPAGQTAASACGDENGGGGL